MIPMLCETPMHIADENFTGLQVVLQVKDHMRQEYYDDGVCGWLEAEVAGGTLTVHSEGMDVQEIVAYLPAGTEKAVVNGEEWRVQAQGNALLLRK